MTAPRIVPLVTLWQEQITASSGSADGPSATGRAGAGGQHQLLGRDRRDGAGERPQHAVRVGVADQDAAEQLAVAADDQLLVDAGAGVGVHDVQAALGGAVRVAEGGHVHAEQLQLGGQVGAGEGRLASPAMVAAAVSAIS